MVKCIIIADLGIFNQCIAREALSEGEVLSFVNDALPLCGILKRSNHFLYVDLDDDYIYKLAPLIQKEDFSPPPYFGTPELVGAHISVAFPVEIENIAEVAGCGSKIIFTPKKCEIVRLTQPSSLLQNVEEIYLLVVEAPQLDQIREKYGLSEQYYPFHITLGVKYSHAPALSTKLFR